MTTRPLLLSRAVFFFGIPALLFLTIQRAIIPYLDEMGVSPLVNFLVLGIPHLLFFLGALVAYRIEGHPWHWSALSERFRLTRLGGKDWGWAIIAALGNILLYMLTFTIAMPLLEWLADLFPDPEVLSEILGNATTFVGFPLSGNVWLLGVYLIFYFFNVMGEELWWRGYIFPRQELIHGQRTWLVHGLLWAGFHLFTPYNALMVLPGALLMSWIVQKRQNTWIFVIAHAALNGMAMIRIVSGIIA